jgi:hypothetical protein
METHVDVLEMNDAPNVSPVETFTLETNVQHLKWFEGDGKDMHMPSTHSDWFVVHNKNKKVSYFVHNRTKYEIPAETFVLLGPYKYQFFVNGEMRVSTDKGVFYCFIQFMP